MDDSTCSGDCGCQRASMADDRGSVSRRGVLTGSAAAVAVLALGACATTDEADSTADPTTSEPAPETPTESSDGTPQESAGTEGEPSGEALAATDFPVGGGVVVANTSQGPIVVTHPTDTEYKGFNARCPHAGCPVAEVLENTIICNCHGSTFDGSTGDRLEGPAPTGLEPVAIQVSDGEIYLA